MTESDSEKKPAPEQGDIDEQLNELKAKVSRVKKTSLLHAVARRQATGGTLSPDDVTVTPLERRRPIFGRPGNVVIADDGADRDQVFYTDFDDADNDILYGDKDVRDGIKFADKDARDQ